MTLNILVTTHISVRYHHSFANDFPEVIRYLFLLPGSNMATTAKDLGYPVGHSETKNVDMCTPSQDRYTKSLLQKHSQRTTVVLFNSLILKTTGVQQRANTKT